MIKLLTRSVAKVSTTIKSAHDILRKERGATVIEYIGLCAIVVLLIGVIMAAFEGGGSGLGQSIFNGFQNWLTSYFGG